MIITKEAADAALALQNRGNVAKFFSIEFLEQKDEYFLFNMVVEKHNLFQSDHLLPPVVFFKSRQTFLSPGIGSYAKAFSPMYSFNLNAFKVKDLILIK